MLRINLSLWENNPTCQMVFGPSICSNHRLQWVIKCSKRIHFSSSPGQRYTLITVNSAPCYCRNTIFDILIRYVRIWFEFTGIEYYIHHCALHLFIRCGHSREILCIYYFLDNYHLHWLYVFISTSLV